MVTKIRLSYCNVWLQSFILNNSNAKLPVSHYIQAPYCSLSLLHSFAVSFLPCQIVRPWWSSVIPFLIIEFTLKEPPAGWEKNCILVKLFYNGDYNVTHLFWLFTRSHIPDASISRYLYGCQNYMLVQISMDVNAKSTSLLPQVQTAR